MARSIYAVSRRFFGGSTWSGPGDIEKEVSFLEEVWGRHLTRPVRRVLDIACGDSPHGQILATKGITVVGIDRSPTMIAAGQKNGSTMKFYRRGIERFRIPERQFDAAIFMSETFPVIQSNQDLMYHFKSVGQTLRRRRSLLRRYRST